MLHKNVLQDMQGIRILACFATRFIETYTAKLIEIQLVKEGLHVLHEI